ncbi:MAG TPA: winged helix-turn-helix domain-containing protein [Vicinamibacterales bacterium]
MLHRFGIFEFDSDCGELRKNGRIVALEPQPAKALGLLLARAGDVVGREEMRNTVWGRDTHVDFDRGLAYCVSQIRGALGDSGENPRFVQTVPKRGFKFIAPVTCDPPIARSPVEQVAKEPDGLKVLVLLGVVFTIGVIALFAWTLNSAAPSAAAPVVIAVSIFDNETGHSEYDRPVAALSDLVVEHLTKLDPARIAVVGNAAVLRQPRNIRNLKAVAEGVHADYVLLGQLQKGESGLRFITHFIRLKDEAHLKANRLSVGDANLAGLEAAVVDEFDRAVREHILTSPDN